MALNSGWVFLTSILLSGMAHAQDVTVYGGVAASTNYVFRSVTFSDDKPVLQPYIEAEINGFYSGIWASNVDFGPGTTDNLEVDYYIGYRGETAGGFGYDVNYARFTFDDTGDCCGEYNVSLTQSFGGKYTASAIFAYDPDASALASAFGASVDLSDRLSLSGLYGYDELLSHNYWDLGLNYGLNDTTALDVRYFDTSDGDSIFALTVSFDTTLFGG
jgi:uncharacterized protein (TIGR02001 family)